VNVIELRQHLHAGSLGVSTENLRKTWIRKHSYWLLQLDMWSQLGLNFESSLLFQLPVFVHIRMVREKGFAEDGCKGAVKKVFV